MEDSVVDADFEFNSLTSSVPRGLFRIRKAREEAQPLGFRCDTVDAVYGGTVGAPDSACADEKNNSPTPALQLESHVTPRSGNLSDIVAQNDGWAGKDLSREENNNGLDEKYWDEEDELQEQLEFSQQSNEQVEDTSQKSEDSENSANEPLRDSDGEDFGSEVLAAETQRVLRESAKTDCIGKGFNITVKPISGVLSKLKQKREALIARAMPARTAEKTNTVTRTAPQIIPALSVAQLAGEVAVDEKEELLILESDEEDHPAPAALCGPDKEDVLACSVEEASADEDTDASQSSGSVSEDEYEESCDTDVSSDEDSEQPAGEATSNVPTEADREAARMKALEEARLLLRDTKDIKNRSYLEEEAEMSEDGGHSDEDDSDGEGDDSVLEDLIGHETDGRHDEKMRARLHAEWAAKQEEQHIKGLMEGLKNGFKRKRRAGLLDEDEGTNRDARWRRALLAAADEDDDAMYEDKHDVKDTGAEDDTTALSDDEDREALNYFKHQKMLKDSQADEEDVDLLDDGQKAILGLLEKSKSDSLPVLEPAIQSARVGSNNKTYMSKVSFLGRASSSTLGEGTKTVSLLGTTRSFVFGKENSQLESSMDLGLPQGEAKATDPPQNEATTFAGVSRLISSHHAAARDTHGQRNAKHAEKRPGKLLHAILTSSMSQKLDHLDGSAQVDQEICLKDALKHNTTRVFGIQVQRPKPNL
eukprot:jgi/Botrbrau1/23354/Bobra.0051s0012.1